MFKQTLLSKARRNREIIDYAPTYNRRNRSSKWYSPLSLLKWLLLVGLLAGCAFYVMPLNATTYNNYSSLDDVSSGQLLFESTETVKTNLKETQLYQSAILLNSAASFDINGIIASVTVTQSFLNTGNEITNGLYTFPLPENSAVNYLKIQVGKREIEGKILEKNEAKKLFNQAKASGKKASLVEQHRPNLFTNKIANIAPNEQITVTIKYVQHVDYTDGEFSLRFPMSITPRYQPVSLPITSDNLETKNETGFYSSSTRLLNEDLSISELSQFTQLNKNQINLRVNLNAGIQLASIDSPSHTLKLNNNELNGESVKISVGNVQVPMDKDFVLQWRPKASNAPQLSLYNQTLDGEEYTLAMLLPPIYSTLDDNEQLATSFARDITFIIDTSGSMQGESMIQAKQSLRFALNTLTEHDSFNIIAFESLSTNLFRQTKMATSKNIANALTFINQLSADGGTEMYQPLSNALSMQQTPLQNENAIKQILFITDGAVSNELALFKLIKKTTDLPRLFTVGIGSAPNGFFMRKAAQFGQGSYTFIGNIDEVEKKMAMLLEKISQPALTNINVQFHPLHLGNIEQFPNKIPDLYANEPLIIAFKTTDKPASIQMFGDLANKGWQQEVELNTAKTVDNNSGISSIWARAKIEDLLDGLVVGKPLAVVKNDVIMTSLKHQVMSPYTSFIAVEKEILSADEIDKRKEELLAQKEKQASQKLASQNSLHATVFPKTAVGWKLQLLLGLALLAISLLWLSRLKRNNHEVSL
ncbi:marine proteobacterial sortase target protein [Pseudocolwellia sp. HL-MZ19]|uniref:marine proteobacterial sortase target protein n=1 Tax=Pseudocolwellia sp. HL-MZ19 TaxID=3400846 RepID=UPI003CEA386D